MKQSFRPIKFQIEFNGKTSFAVRKLASFRTGSGSFRNFVFEACISSKPQFDIAKSRHIDDERSKETLNGSESDTEDG